MTPPDFSAILAAAKRAQAAYIIDAKASQAAFEALGYTWIGQYEDDDSQAVLTRDAKGAVNLSISGTRFSAGKIGDLIDDLQTEPYDIGGGARVTRGPYQSAGEIWAWAKGSVPAGTVFNVEGHSLGGWRTSYTPLFLPAAQIGTLHAFEPPKGANAAYYARFSAELANLIIVGNGRDIWFGYPRLGEWIHRPGSMVWLRTSGFSVIDTTAWPGGLSLADHSIDLVVSRLVAIAISQQQAIA
ncbi:hypothetical protein KTD31_17460 [Burkholderia multivorans]|uniref:hypothetical protein n=1 Tax=Burkholderia multivorans TaxID=87883 RepID=UPI000A71D8D7|nr:hypothetical protein [Burkholderia multivorans]MBU9203147.1 hypothetical protein [Burkholderia multivorans]MCA8385386.1 hypothetical protein [Burkholderia multivorans]